MGVRYLNHLLKTECKDGIQLLDLKQLSGKKIAVDISIYLYRYSTEGEESLMDHLFHMLNLFRYYKIIPIFVFDGTAPAEKKALLEKRREVKKIAEKEYLCLKERADSHDSSKEEKEVIQQEMVKLKKKFVSIKKEQIILVKELLDAYGSIYVESLGEADELCAYLVIQGIAWACLSEDMDMFVYGVPRVLRYLSIVNNSVVLYEVPSILKLLNMTQEELRQICILSGCDYYQENAISNVHLRNYDLTMIIDLFKAYQQRKKDEKIGDFFDWITQNTDIINEEKKEILVKTIKKFEMNDLEKTMEFQGYMNNKNVQGSKMQKDKLRVILKKQGFLSF